MKSLNFEIGRFIKMFHRPAEVMRRRFNVAQCGMNINRFTEITAEIFAEFLHVENFTQRREDAKKIIGLNAAPAVLAEQGSGVAK